MNSFPDESTPDAFCDAALLDGARLAALRNYEILDTLPERAYDELTQLAAAICRTPVAVISLLDDRRQWFKARIGMEAQETPVQLSFCRYAIVNPVELMVVPDTTQDERFCAHPFVTGEPQIRFYAGAPLVNADGHALGTLCVVDFVPRELDDSQRQALRVLARQVVAQFELRRALARADRDAALLRQTHEETKMLAAEVHDLYDHAPVGYHSLDAAGVIREINATELGWLGYSREEVIGKLHLTDIVSPECCREFLLHYEQFKQTGQSHTCEVDLLRKDGSTLPCYLRAVAMRDEAGNFLCTRTSASEISGLRNAMQALRESEQRFQAFMEYVPAVTFIKDENGRYLFANSALLRHFQKTRDEFVGHTDAEIWPSKIYARVRASDQAVLKSGKGNYTEETIPMPDGSTSIWLSFKFPLHHAGAIRLLGGIGVDITDRKNSERQLEVYRAQLEEAVVSLQEIAVTDSLTGLKNHGAFRERLEEEVQRARRYKLPLSLAMLDVDYFKNYNDSFGHPAGDGVLRGVAELLKRHARPSDFSARYGGEEFAVILANTTLEGALSHSERIRQAVADNDWPHRAVTVSIGVAAFSPENPDVTSLLIAADNALYKAKHAGRNRVEQSARV